MDKKRKRNGECAAQRKGHVRTQRESGLLQAREGGLRETNLQHLGLGSQPPELRYKFLLFKPLSLWHFVMTALMG
jgi:hypothetical protein